MRRTPTILLTLGVIAAAAAMAWRPLAAPTLTKIPTNLSVTDDFSGTLTSFVDPRTGARLPSPLQLPVDLRLKVTSAPGSDANRVVVRQATTTTTTGAAPVTTASQYVLDRGTGKATTGGREGAWELSSANRINAAGDYVLGPPIGAHGAQYPFWVDELQAPVPLRADGTSQTLDGLALRGFVAKTGPTAVPQAYATGLGLPATEPMSAVAAELKGAGVDLLGTLGGLKSLTPAEAAGVQQLGNLSLPLRYTFSLDLRMLVDPDTGAVVSIPRQVRNLSASVDLAPAVAALTPLLAGHAQDPAVQAMLPMLSRLSAPPAQPLTTVQAAQTPASVAAIAAQTRSDRQSLLLVTVWVPIALGVLAALLLAGALVVGLRGRRRRPEEPVVDELEPVTA